MLTVRVGQRRSRRQHAVKQGVSWSMARRRRNLPFLKVDEKPQGMGVIQALKAWMVIWLQKLS